MPPFSSVSPVCVQPAEQVSYPELAGKRVLITGISSTTAVSIARSFAAQGCRLVLHFAVDGSDAVRDVSEMADTAQALRVFACDFATTADIERFGEAAARAYGGVDIIVNLLPAADLDLPDSVSASEIEQRIGAQLRSAQLLSDIAAVHMCRRPGGGVIINVASGGQACSAQARSGKAFALQAIASTAIEGMTRKLAADWSDDDIRVNALLLGEEPEADEFEAGIAPVGEAAASALYLATRSSRWLSGSAVRL